MFFIEERKIGRLVKVGADMMSCAKPTEPGHASLAAGPTLSGQDEFFELAPPACGILLLLLYFTLACWLAG